MPDLRYWLAFVVAFLVVVAVLTIGAAIHEYWLWKKDSK